MNHQIFQPEKGLGNEAFLMNLDVWITKPYEKDKYSPFSKT